MAYNVNFEVVAENTGILPVTDKINKIQNLSSDRIVIQENGFIEVFANNEAQTPVFFDNLSVSHSPGRVLEENHYYPYGLLIPGLSSSATVKDERNAYKYNQKELQEELGLGWLDYGARMQNPVEGRFMVPDPLAEKYYSISPYAYTLGNPIRFIDPDGMWVDDYKLKNNGEIEFMKKTDDSFDRLFAEGGSSITVSKNINGGSILSSLVDKSKTFEQKLYGTNIAVNGNYAVTKSGSEAKKVFDFAAENSTVEWGVNNYKNGDWVIGTLREGSYAPDFSNLNSYYNIENTLYDAHSHGGTGSDDFWPSGPDVTTAAWIKHYNPNAEIKLYIPQSTGKLGKRIDLPGPYDFKLKQHIYTLPRPEILKRLNK